MHRRNVVLAAAVGFIALLGLSDMQPANAAILPVMCWLWLTPMLRAELGLQRPSCSDAREPLRHTSARKYRAVESLRFV